MSAANDTFTHVTPVTNGELRVSAVHGRIHQTYRARDARYPITVQMSADAAERHFQRGLELVQLARAARAKTGDA